MFFLGGDLSQIYLPTHPRVFVRFGKTKGQKRRFSGWFAGILRGLDLVWESATPPSGPPTHIWERSPNFLNAFRKRKWFGNYLFPVGRRIDSGRFPPPLEMVSEHILQFLGVAVC